MKIFSATILTIAILLSSCETKTQTGALVGGGLGATTGALITHGSVGGALIGGAIGAVGGGLIGYSLDEQDRRNMEQQSPRTLRRIDNGEPLSKNDIKDMTRAGLNDDVIISQIQSTHTIFYLSTADIINLKDAGVSQRVIDYMIRTGNQ